MHMEGQYLERPDSDVIDDIKNKKDEILKQARIFGVNPRAVVASLITVNTLRPERMGESIKKFISKPNDSSKGLKFGIGRFEEEEFEGLEKYSAKFSPRITNPQNKSVKYRTNLEIKKLMDDGKADIEYAVAHLKRRLMIYESAGFEIGNNIPMMSTIYGLPSVANRVSTHVKKGTKPKINAWGVVSVCQEHIIDEILGSETKKKLSDSRYGQHEPKWDDPGVLREDEENLKGYSSFGSSRERSEGKQATKN